MEQLLEQATKMCEGAEVFSVSGKATQAIFETNRLKSVQTKESEGTALRIIKNGRIGFSAGNRSGGEGNLLSMALEMSPFGAEAKFDLPGLCDYSAVSVFDREVERGSEEEMAHLGQSMIDEIRQVSSDIICEASVNRSISNVGILNSSGGRANYPKSVFSIALDGVIIRGTDMLFVGDYQSSCHPITDFKPVVESIIRQLEWAKDLVAAPSGTLPVVFSPHGVGNALITALLVGFNGKTVLRGASPLGHRKGEKVFSSDLSVWDDATIDFCPAGSICDDEGMPSRRTALIERGVVANFIYDLQTAGQAGTQSTGNASRSLTSLPSPSTNAVIIGEGNTSFEEMIADIKEGLVVEQLMGATQGNVLSGDFSGNVLLGYKVENGRIVGRVKDTMVSGNIYDIMKDGIVIGNDSRWVGGGLQTPSILCPRVAVAAKV